MTNYKVTFDKANTNIQFTEENVNGTDTFVSLKDAKLAARNYLNEQNREMEECLNRIRHMTKEEIHAISVANSKYNQPALQHN